MKYKSKEELGCRLSKQSLNKRIKTFDCFTVSNTKQSSSKNHNHMNCSILFPVNFSFPNKILSQILRAQIVQILHHKFDEFSTVAIWLHNHVTKLGVKGVPTRTNVRNVTRNLPSRMSHQIEVWYSAQQFRRGIF